MLRSPTARTEQGLTFLCSFARPPVTLPLYPVSCQNQSVPALLHPFAIMLARWTSLCFGALAVQSSLFMTTNYWDQQQHCDCCGRDCTAVLTWAQHTSLLLIAHLLISWGEPGSSKEILQSLQKAIAEELQEEEWVRAPWRSRSRAWSWSAL